MFKDIQRAVVAEYSGQRAKGDVAEIIQYHRIQASPGFRAAARHVQEVLAKLGLSAEVLSYPANDQTVYWGSSMFQEWEATEATLYLVEPEDRARKLADFSECKLSLIQRSMSAKDVEGEVVLLEDGEEAVPIVHRLAAGVLAVEVAHEIELVGQRPPDVAERAQPGDAVAQVAVVLLVTHEGKAPAVVGVPEDLVRIDA